MQSLRIPLILGLVFMAAMVWQGRGLSTQKQEKASAMPVEDDSVWFGASKYQVPVGTSQGNLIWYGEQLIENTSYYFGPKGMVAQISNGMNCQNCHLAAGTLPFGNNFGKTYATYPQYRQRSNSIQTIYGRIADCFERSLNGKAPDSNTLEMKAMYAYIKWLGGDVPKGAKTIKGAGVPKLAYLNRAADAVQGQQVYMDKCSNCHGANGEGQPNLQGTGYAYPPLWGNNSYNDGAGLYRISSFAGYVKNNMPFGSTYKAPQLTAAQAWDVAAFVNSQPRPHKDQSKDWPDIKLKPVDLPFGPYADTFSQQQHKYGPFGKMGKK